MRNIFLLREDQPILVATPFSNNYDAVDDPFETLVTGCELSDFSWRVQAKAIAGTQARLAAFRNALRDLGWTEGSNVRLEVRWSAGNVDRARAFASELVSFVPDVILAGGTTSIATLKQMTSSIPLVFVIVNDPVAQRFVSSVAHPGGNITGFSYIDFSMLAKALQLLKELAPSVNRVGFMFNPDTYPYYEGYLDSLRTQLHELALDLAPLRVRSK